MNRHTSHRSSKPACQRRRPATAHLWPILAGSTLLAIAALAAHWPSHPGDFIWDDYDMIVNNIWLRLPTGILKLWLSINQPDYWPLSYSTHWVEWRIFGFHAPSFRAVNFAVHIINTLLVWRLTTRLVPSLAGIPAWFCALLFAVHPLSVEAVAWILQRKTLLSTTGALASLDFFLTYKEKRHVGWLAASVISFILGLAAKTSVVMLPVAIVVIIEWKTGRLGIGDLRAALPLFLVALILGAVAVWCQQTTSIGKDIVREDSLLSRFALAGYCVWFYLSKAIWPVNLCFNYPRWVVDTASLWTYVPNVAWLSLGAICFWFRRRWLSGAWMSWAWYTLMLFPALGFISIYYMKYSLVADHWQYTALPAVIVLAVGTAHFAIHSLSDSARRSTQPFRLAAALTAITVAALLLFAARGHAALFAGADNRPLYENTVAKNPNSFLAYEGLGTIALRQGKYNDAVHYLSEAVRAAPHDARTLLSYGIALFAAGDRGAAKKQLELASRLSKRPQIVFKLGQFAEAEGDTDTALGYYRQALKLDPRHVDSNICIGQRDLAAGRLEDAQRHLETAIEEDPFISLAHHNLGVVYIRQRHIEQGIEQLRLALKLDPGDQGAAKLLRQLSVAKARIAVPGGE